MNTFKPYSAPMSELVGEEIIPLAAAKPAPTHMRVRDLGPNQLAWLREKCPGFADAEKQWKSSRGIAVV